MDDRLLSLLIDALQAVLWLSAPAVGGALALGLLAALLLSVLQMQDTAVGFVPRLVGATLGLWLGGHFMLSRITELTTALWQRLN